MLLSVTLTPLSLFFQSHGAHRDLPSFPTRRSSDLRARAGPAGPNSGGRRGARRRGGAAVLPRPGRLPARRRSEEHTSELQSLRHLVCRLLLEKKKKKK